MGDGGSFIIACITLIAGAIVCIVIGAIVTGEYVKLDTYSTANCTGITNTYIGNTLGYYHCHGYADIYNNNNTKIGQVKLEQPPYNYLLVKVTEAACNSWISSLNDNKFHECRVDNIYSSVANGYTNVQSVAGYVAMMVIGALIIIIPIVIGCIMMIKNTYNTMYILESF
jgi:hypothetical protein